MEKLGVIGGSGLYHLGSESVKINDIDTPYGRPSSAITKCVLSGCEIYFLPRHGEGHSISPSDINYRANIFALKRLGIHRIISVSAVGSLVENLHPGMFFLPDQFIDWTKGKRQRTFFDDGLVGHVSLGFPVSENMLDLLERSCREISAEHQRGGSYLCIEGPQFSTKAESLLYKSFGAQVIGMTNVPEAYLAKEANIDYVTLAMVTDYDCWKEQHCTVEEIMKVMRENVGRAKDLLEVFCGMLAKNSFVLRNNANPIVTCLDNISLEKRQILDILLK